MKAPKSDIMLAPGYSAKQPCIYVFVRIHAYNDVTMLYGYEQNAHKTVISRHRQQRAAQNIAAHAVPLPLSNLLNHRNSPGHPQFRRRLVTAAAGYFINHNLI